MKKIIKNVSPGTLSLFARVNGREAKFEVGSGKSLVVDNHETRTIIIYKKKGLITMLPYTGDNVVVKAPQQKATLDGANKGSVADIDVLHEHAAKAKTIDETVDPNSDEVMDQFHTTETHETLTINDDGVAIETNSASRFEVVEGEVKQYVEDGFIKGAWSEDDIAFLKKNYPTKGRSFCSVELNRNESSVQKKINSLGLKKKKRRGRRK